MLKELDVQRKEQDESNLRKAVDKIHQVAKEVPLREIFYRDGFVKSIQEKPTMKTVE